MKLYVDSFPTIEFNLFLNFFIHHNSINIKRDMNKPENLHFLISLSTIKVRNIWELGEFSKISESGENVTYPLTLTDLDPVSSLC